MKMLVTRPYASELDLQPIADLLNACEAVDHLGAFYSAADLQLEVTAPHVDSAHDLRLWETSAGELIAFSQLWIPESANPLDGYVWFRVHPEARGHGLESDILAWADKRMRNIGYERGVAVQLRSSSRDSLIDQITRFKRSGFEVDRQFFTLGRSLLEAIDDPLLPDGFTLQRNTADPADWVDLFNESFIDHWNHHPLTIETYSHGLTDPKYRADLDLVAIAPDGRLAAFCYCSIDDETNQHLGQQDGWVNLLGTRRGFRRLGLGRAMVLAGLHQLQQAGMTTAKIGVDTQNPNGARQLYESIGFKKQYANLSFLKNL